MAEKKAPPNEDAAKKGAGAEKPIIVMPVSDVAEWDDEARLKSSPPVDFPYSGLSEEELRAGAKKLPKPKAE